MNYRTGALLILALCASFTSLLAGEGDPVQAKAKQIAQDMHQAFQAKNYQSALEKAQLLVELSPDAGDSHYNLACAQARLGKTDDALASLNQAIEKGYSDLGHMKADEDLASLRDDKRFAELAQKLRDAESKAPFEKGADMEGVKTIDELPDGGLRYRLRMSPTATDEKPSKLVVWLHPSGGSMNNVAERMAPLFIKRGFALLVLTKKQWMGWAGPEMDQLLNKTLPAVDKTPGIDASRPILMGFSAGGQAALTVWEQNPGAFGGLVLDAAYPLDMEKYSRGKPEPLTLPKSDDVKKTPFFVLVGDQDGGAQIWKKVEEPWRAAGVPITIEYVAGGKHQWLFGKSQAEKLAKWLDEIAAGKLPSDAPAKAEVKTEPFQDPK